MNAAVSTPSPAAHRLPGGSRAALAAIMVLTVWAPVPLGSNRDWSQNLLAAGFLGLGFAVLVASLWRRRQVGDVLSPGRLPLALLVGCPVFALLQMAPLPGAVLGVLSPNAASAWQGAGVSGAASLSLDRGAGAAEALHLASLAAVFALTLWCVTTRRRLELACAVVVFLGVAEALLGIGTALAREAGWIPRGPVEGVGGAAGTFVNPNHFAGLLEMAFAVSLGLMLTAGSGAVPVSARELIARALGLALSAPLLLVVAQLLMLTALLWSGSRGAVAALAVSIPLVFAVILPPRRGSGAAPRVALVAGMALTAVLALGFGGSGSLGEKLSAHGLASNRLQLAADSIDMAMDFPVTGAGAGSYAAVFPAYKSEVLGNAFYEHAHNDYLEVLAEGGVIGFALFFGAVGAALGGALTRARRRESRGARALTGGCAAGAICLLVHGLYDFNLQIPANATLFVLLLALAVRAATLGRGEIMERPA